ncbi:MAG: hypothetical protein ABIZ64_12035 [Casimicrobium sp.]
MSRYLLSVLVLLAVGFAYGALRNRASVTKRIPVWVIVILLLGIFFVGLLLAFVTGSATLGWISGLSLMVLFPVAMFLGVGFAIGSIFNRTKAPPPSPPIGREAPAALVLHPPASITANDLSIHVDRDSVAAGDDTVSHAATAAMRNDSTVMELVAAALRVCPLANISGDKATWLIDVDTTCIGVIAQQWPRPRFIIAEHTSVTDVFAGKNMTLHFRYWCQADPDAVFEAVRLGQPLPPRY